MTLSIPAIRRVQSFLDKFTRRGRADDERSTSAGMLALLSLFLILLVWTVYYPALAFPFTSFDDPMYVADNVWVQRGLTPDGMVYAATSLQGFWQPMVWLFYMTIAEFLGPHSASFHFANVFIHAANVALVFLIAYRLSNLLNVSFILAALFAAHPCNVESVAWVSEAKGLLASFFALVSTFIYARHAQNRRIGSYLAVALCYVLGLLAKPSIVLLPFLFLAWDFWGAGKDARTSCRQVLGAFFSKAPMLVIGCFILGITYFAQHQFGAIKHEVSLIDRVSNAIVSIMAYLAQTLYPRNFSVFYPLEHPIPLFKTAFSALVVGTAFFLIGRSGKFARLLILGFVLFLLPQVGLLQIGDHARADRYLYLPIIFLLGIPLTLCSAFFKRSQNSLMLIIAFATLICSFTVNARSNLLHWRSDKDLFTHAIKSTSERNFVAQNVLGLWAMNHGSLEEAASHFITAIEIVPSSPTPRHNLALTYQLAGKAQLAESQYKAALALTPNDPGTLINYAGLLTSKGKPYFCDARMLARRAICSNYREFRAYDVLAGIYFETGDTNRAARVWELATRVNSETYDK